MKLISPPPPDLSAAADLVSRIEKRLGRWLDLEPNPTIEQIASASQAIWRLAAVRKTIMLAGGRYPERPKSLKELDPELAAICRMVADLEIAAKARYGTPSRPGSPNPASLAPAKACTDSASPIAKLETSNLKLETQNPFATQESLDSTLETLDSILASAQSGQPLDRQAKAFLADITPKLASLPPLPRITLGSLAPFRTPPLRRTPDSVTSTSSMSSTSPVSSSPFSLLPSSFPVACPSLRAPLHTARTAQRQVESLYESSGLPKNTPAPLPPKSDPSDPSDASSLPNAKHETQNLKLETTRSASPHPRPPRPPRSP